MRYKNSQIIRMQVNWIGLDVDNTSARHRWTRLWNFDKSIQEWVRQKIFEIK